MELMRETHFLVRVAGFLTTLLLHDGATAPDLSFTFDKEGELLAVHFTEPQGHLKGPRPAEARAVPGQRSTSAGRDVMVTASLPHLPRAPFCSG